MGLLDTLATARAVAGLLPDLPRALPFSRTNPGKLVQGCARRTPTALAIAFEDQRFTWKDVNDRSNRYAFWFSKQGVNAGEVVAIDMDNRPDFLFALTGLSKLGAVGALINTNLTGRSLTHAIEVSGARKVLAGSEHHASVCEAVNDIEGLSTEDIWTQLDAAPGASTPASARIINDEVAEAPDDECGDAHSPKIDDTYCYIYTSGTTGLPKAAIISNQRMVVAGVGFSHLMHRCGAGDVIYVTLPLYHSSAMFLGWGSAINSGAAIALRRKFSASNFWKDVRTYGATSFLYIGELCRYLLNMPPQEGERDHKIRVATGNGMRPDIWEPFQKRFNVPVIREFYGATEGNTALMNFEGRPGMIGRTMPGQALLRCDLESGEVVRNAEGLCEPVGIGEIGLLVGRISGTTSFDGYVDRKATEKKIMRDVFKKGDAYFNTGDLLELHAGRWLSFADRVGDTFRWKGENVSTNEVADRLDGAEHVLEANVYGVQVPNADGRAGMTALNVDEGFELDAFAAYVMEHLTKYQRPQFLRILGGEMRVTGTFKHQKVDYRKEGYDPSVVKDPLYVLRGETYVPLDASTFAALESGEITLA